MGRPGTKALLLPLLITVLGSLPTDQAKAQTFTTIKSFGILTNVTGFNPRSALVQGPDGTLYGTTYDGESSVRGTVFKVQPDGSGFTVLKWFTNSVQGANPSGGLTLSGSLLYGTTYAGGNSLSPGGTVFRMNTDGTGYTVLHSFTGSPDGQGPQGGLTISGSVLYGTTVAGGNSDTYQQSGWGTVFKINTNGTGYAVLKRFTGNDGDKPNGGLALSGGVLYGTTSQVGDGGTTLGTIFQININGTGYAVLYNFAGSPDGLWPLGGLTLSGNVLYGTTSGGGSSGHAGTVFQVNTDGTGYNVLYDFADIPDGSHPSGELTLSGNVLYGTTGSGGGGGGPYGYGTVFQINTDGSGYNVLYNFTSTPDGAGPYGSLTISGGTLYGTTGSGGTSGFGTVFQLNTDGTGYGVLANFVGYSDGADPQAGPTASDNVLYGTTYGGGSHQQGTVYKVNVDGTSYRVLRNFAGSDGGRPTTLTLSDGVLYGTTISGGMSNAGTVFRLNADGSGYSVLKDYNGSDGSEPNGLVLSGSVLYGATDGGGSAGQGTLFKVNTDGTAYTALRTFTGTGGANPNAGLILSGATLYGTTFWGGSGNGGTVFAVSTNGTGYRVLKSFSGSDGELPSSGLAFFGGTLYGTTSSRGSANYGTLFRVNTDGTGFLVLRNQTSAGPSAGGLVLSGNVLYGTSSGGGSGTVFRMNTDGTGYAALQTFAGGAYTGRNGLALSGNVLYGVSPDGGGLGDGMVFGLALPVVQPPLAVAPAGGTVVLSWPTTPIGFTLESTTNLGLAATWTTNSDLPVLVNGLNTVTNPISTAQQFYRLMQ